MINLFILRKEEKWLAAAFLLVLVGLNLMLIDQYSPLFLKCGKVGYWSVFSKNFRMSGYDCWSYITLSNLRIHFETVRHPLFLSMLWPLYQLNHWLMGVTGVNCAVYIMAVLTTFCAVYALVFLYRTMREVLALKVVDATLLTLLFFSFAHVVVAMMVPDHFVFSLFLLTLTLYVSGKAMKEHRPLSVGQSAALLFFTAGITLTNGAKTLLAMLFVNGRRLFRPKSILLGILLPLLLLGGIWWYQYQAFEVPQQKTVHRIENALRKKTGDAFDKHVNERGQWMKAHSGEPVSDLPLLNMTDVTTPRIPTLVENFFGETIQLHQDYLLQDMSHTRPVFVTYRWTLSYVVEALVVLLFVAGLWAGRRRRFIQLCLTWFGVDVMLHLVLGFGINEVYIMAANWIFIIPLAIAALAGELSSRRALLALRILVALLTCYLLVYNGHLLLDYLSIPYKQLAK